MDREIQRTNKIVEIANSVIERMHPEYRDEAKKTHMKNTVIEMCLKGVAYPHRPRADAETEHVFGIVNAIYRAGPR
jgi:hypothetical protein